MQTIDDARRLHRQVIMFTVAIWAVHFAALMTSSVLTGRMTEGAIPRAVSSAVGMLIGLGLHQFLRTRRVRRTSRQLVTAISLAVPASLLVSLVNQLCFVFLTPAYRESTGRSGFDAIFSADGMFLGEVAFGAVLFFWIFVAWSAIYAGALYAAEARERERRLAQAEKAAQQAQITALRFQINPHFLFNTLNALSGLIGMGQGKEAERVVLNLSAFLRYSLAMTPQQLVTLEEELRAQQMYLDIERVRFGERLTVSTRCEDDVSEALVPSLILQPLVENAVKYGVAPSTEPVELAIEARRDGRNVVVSVRNGGPVADVRFVHGTGTGLRNVERRLETLYGDGAGLETRRLEDGGFEAVIRLPWLTEQRRERPKGVRSDPLVAPSAENVALGRR